MGRVKKYGEREANEMCSANNFNRVALNRRPSTTTSLGGESVPAPSVTLFMFDVCGDGAPAEIKETPPTDPPDGLR